MLTAQASLPGLSSSVPTARHFVESLLSAWGSPELAWTAALVASELAANCALHARTAFTVRIAREQDGAARLEVADASARVPQQRAYALDATTGRGLRLVEQLAQSWGVDGGPDGKTVWVVLAADDGSTDDTSHGDGPDADALLAAFDDGAA